MEDVRPLLQENVDSWYVGKRQLVAAQIPAGAAERLSPRKLAENASALRYLVVLEGIQSCNVDALKENVVEILRRLPRLRIQCNHFDWDSEGLYGHGIPDAEIRSRVVPSSGPRIPAWEIVEAHNNLKGDNNCFRLVV